MLQIKNLEASYGSLKVLKGINIDVNRGDLVAIIGPNGSGKSTAIKCIFGLLKVDKGEILFNEKHIENKNPDKIVRLGISYVPQGRRVFSTLTVQENLEMGAYILNDKKQVKERIRVVFDYFPGLEEKKGQKATFLSGGQQQMLSIGRSLMLKPSLLLLDEPSLGLAPKLMKEIFEKIVEINKKGTTIVLVEQNAHKALEICNKAYVLENGRIALHGKDLTKEKLVKELYFGE